MIKVYLSGGMRSGWQDEVKMALDKQPVHWLDPRESGFTEPEQYALYDLMALDHCDLVFAYLEASNPSGYGLMFEVGYALAKGKPVIFVNEMFADPRTFLAAAASDLYMFDKLSDALQVLQSLSKIFIS